MQTNKTIRSAYFSNFWWRSCRNTYRGSSCCKRIKVAWRWRWTLWYQWRRRR